MQQVPRPPLVAVWLRELRAPFFTASILPAVFGAVYARYAGASFNWGLFGLTVLGAVLAHAGCNIGNDYFDHVSGNDLLTRSTPFSGGSKVIQEGLLRPGEVLAGSIVCLVLAAGIGFYLNAVTGGWVLLVVGIIGVVIAWFYSAPPVQFGRRSGAGELVCVLGCGPIIAFGSYFVQAGRFSWAAVAAGLPIGILMGLVLFINEFHDIAADGAVGKRTLVVVLGTKASVVVLVAGLVASYGLTALFIVMKVLPVTASFAFVTVPLAAFAAARAARYHAESAKLLPANAAIIGLHSVFGSILILVAAL